MQVSPRIFTKQMFYRSRHYKIFPLCLFGCLLIITPRTQPNTHQHTMRCIMFNTTSSSSLLLLSLLLCIVVGFVERVRAVDANCPASHPWAWNGVCRGDRTNWVFHLSNVCAHIKHTLSHSLPHYCVCVCE